MRKLLLLASITVFSIAVVKAQIARPTKGIKKTAVSQPKTAPASATHYYLSSAKVNIFTGNDNKELPSSVSFSLLRLTKSHYSIGEGDGTTLLYSYLIQGNNKLEFKPNSNAEIALTNIYSFPYTFPGGAYDGWRYNELDLEDIQKNGLRLVIYYTPNFILDAWKTEKVILTLEFKDLNGNPHPSMATVTIPFLNASKLLKDGSNDLVCETDRFLLPKN